MPIDLTPSPTPQPIRTLGESTLNLRELWRFHTGPISSGGAGSSLPHIHVTKGKVIVSYGTGKVFCDQDCTSLLTALSLETGQVVWQTYLDNPGFGTRISSSRLDDERLYLVYGFRANAFSLETGELLWSTLDPERRGGHTTYDFRPWEPLSPLLLHSSADEVLAIDSQTGKILSRQEEKGPAVQTDQIDFVRTVEGLCVVNRQTGQTLWERLEAQPAERQLNLWPSFIEDDMVFQVGTPCYDIIRANVQTGRVIWETSGRNYLSNFALAGSRVYALREDLTLVAFDLNTGAILGTLQFDGPPAETVCREVGGTVYWVVADGPYVIVYFGDSRELFVFQETALQP